MKLALGRQQQQRGGEKYCPSFQIRFQFRENRSFPQFAKPPPSALLTRGVSFHGGTRMKDMEHAFYVYDLII